MNNLSASLTLKKGATLLALGLALGVQFGCASVSVDSTPVSELPAQVTFLISQPNGEDIPGVDVELVTRRGAVRHLGVTSLDGTLRVSRELLRSEGLVVMFCMDWFICSAVRVKEDDLLLSGERLVTLSPAALR